MFLYFPGKWLNWWIKMLGEKDYSNCKDYPPRKKHLVYVCYHHKEILDDDYAKEKGCESCQYSLKLTSKQIINLFETHYFWKSDLEKKIDS